MEILGLIFIIWWAWFWWRPRDRRIFQQSEAARIVHRTGEVPPPALQPRWWQRLIQS